MFGYVHNGCHWGEFIIMIVLFIHFQQQVGVIWHTDMLRYSFHPEGYNFPVTAFPILFPSDDSNKFFLKNMDLKV